jgi:NADH-quinone oxidoreductase E subunit
MATEITTTVFKSYPAGKKEFLLPILQDLQDQLGHLDDELISEVGKYLNLPINKVYGVAAFYSSFKFHPKGKYHIRICKGTACHLHGGSNYLCEIEKRLKVKAGNTSRDRRFSLEVTTCMGACEASPILEINNTIHTRVTPEELNTIIRSLKEKTE